MLVRFVSIFLGYTSTPESGVCPVTPDLINQVRKLKWEQPQRIILVSYLSTNCPPTPDVRAEVKSLPCSSSLPLAVFLRIHQCPPHQLALPQRHSHSRSSKYYSGKASRSSSTQIITVVCRRRSNSAAAAIHSQTAEVRIIAAKTVE